MSCHVSSCAAERNGSAWGRTYTSLRNRLSMEKAEQLMFVKANMAVEQETEDEYWRSAAQRCASTGYRVPNRFLTCIERSRQLDIDRLSCVYRVAKISRVEQRGGACMLGKCKEGISEVILQISAGLTSLDRPRSRNRRFSTSCNLP